MPVISTPTLTTTPTNLSIHLILPCSTTKDRNEASENGKRHAVTLKTHRKSVVNREKHNDPQESRSVMSKKTDDNQNSSDQFTVRNQVCDERIQAHRSKHSDSVRHF